MLLTLLTLSGIEARLVMRFRKFMGNRRFILLVAAISLVAIAAGGTFLFSRAGAPARETTAQVQIIHLDQLAKLVRDGAVRDITLNGDLATITMADGSTAVVRKESQASLLETLRGYGVPEAQIQAVSLDVRDPVTAGGTSGTWAVVIVTGVTIVFILGLIFIVSRGGGAGRYGSFTRSGARMFGRSKTEKAQAAPAVTFSDVAGVDEARQELAEVVDFLKYPEKFTALGARIPKGVLLVGPPGTGKTLLARAVAGEAGVPFLSISGSEFVEMFVGVGASRVRDLFGRARRAAPCIVFVDEIDAVGRHRSAGVRGGHGGHDEREQTLNQILVEMDGFDGRTGVVVIAATNRPDVLDEALLRPGRFDRQVMLDNPDIKGRKAILSIHSKGKPLSRGVDLDTVARQTPGFSGADLANLLNEAAILAARRNKKSIAQGDIEEAVDRVIAGPQRKSRVISERERKVTSFHEVGHAMVATALPNCDIVHKVTIIGRGRAGGFTRFLPAEDRSLWARSQFLDTLAAMLGGHVAEEIVFGEVTTGASNDIERATELAERMVCQYGMSDRFGPLALGRAEPGSQVGRGGFEQKAYSDEMAREIDQEIRLLMDDARARAKAVLSEHRSSLDEISLLLLEKETLSGDEFRELLKPAISPEPLAVEMVAPQPVVESVPVHATSRASSAKRVSAPAVSPSARVAKRLRLRPNSVLAAVGKQPGQIARKAAEVAGALKPEPETQEADLDMA
ncbi:MAG TPA: ATP-dependent zinc metalloprotease FtsH [Chloroflexota bacterium]